MRLVFAGTPAIALPSLDALLASPHDVVAVITRPDTTAGRGRKEVSSPVAVRARELGLPVLQPDRPSDLAFLEELAAIDPACVPVVAYGALVPPPALAIPSKGWVNLHFSLLPAWRGAAPVQRAILHGDEVTGATTFLLEAGLDTGPVFGVMTEEIRPTDTSGDLLDRLAAAGAGLLVATIDGIESGELAPKPQPAEGVSLAPKLVPADVRVDWSAPAQHIDRLVRAATPAPGPWTIFRDKRLKIGPVSVATGAEPLPPGALRDRSKDGVLVGSATHPVLLRTVQPEGKAMMAAVDWARGVRPAPGESFQ